MVKIYVQTPLKFWFHIKFSREYDYVNEYPYSAKLQNMTCWTESGTQSSHIKGLDKCVWCWVCSVLSKQRGEVVWWGGGVRFTKANCGQESQWPYTDCGPAVTGMFSSWVHWLYLKQFKKINLLEFDTIDYGICLVYILHAQCVHFCQHYVRVPNLTLQVNVEVNGLSYAVIHENVCLCPDCQLQGPQTFQAEPQVIESKNDFEKFEVCTLHYIAMKLFPLKTVLTKGVWWWGIEVHLVNSPVPGKVSVWFLKCNFQSHFTDSYLRSSYHNILTWMPWDLTNDNLTFDGVVVRSLTHIYATIGHH